MEDLFTYICCGIATLLAIGAGIFGWRLDHGYIKDKEDAEKKTDDKTDNKKNDTKKRT